MSTTAKLRWTFAIFLIAALALVVALLEAPVFEIENVQISGAARTSEGAILDALDLAEGQALLTTDLSSGQQAVGALPWVESVALSRQWPSTLRVVVRERTVATAIGHPSGRSWVVLSSDGTVVESRLSPPGSVPLIIATADIVDNATVGEQLAGVDRALEIAHALPGQLDPWVTTWTARADGSVAAELVGSARAEFGALADHRTQFVSLASILDGGADLVCLSEIDLTIADTPVLHRDGACLIASQELS